MLLYGVCMGWVHMHDVIVDASAVKPPSSPTPSTRNAPENTHNMCHTLNFPRGVPFIQFQGVVSAATAERVDAARHAVLQHFGACPREWSVVFTSGATAALKLVGEQFPWRPGGRFAHARASHNSVLGVREYARAGGASVECLDLDRDVPRSGETVGRDGPDTCCCCARRGGGDNGVSCKNAASDGGEPRRWRSGGETRRVLGSRDAAGAEDGARGVHRGDGGGEGRDKGGIDGEHGGGSERVANGGGSPREEEKRHGDRGAGPGGAGATGSVAGEVDTAACTSGGVGFESGGDNDDDDGGGVGGGGAHGDAIDCLFAFPAECNATGARPDLAVAGRVKRGALGSLNRCSTCCCCCCCCTSDGRRSIVCVRHGGGAENDPRRRRTPQRSAASGTLECCCGGDEKGKRGTALSGGTRRPSAASTARCRERWWVMLDAAKFVGTSPLDLSSVDADFVALSFYKMFG